MFQPKMNYPGGAITQMQIQRYGPWLSLWDLATKILPLKFHKIKLQKTFMAVKRNRYIDLILLGREQGFPFLSSPLPSCPVQKLEFCKLAAQTPAIVSCVELTAGKAQGHEGFSETVRVHLLELIMVSTNVK